MLPALPAMPLPVLTDELLVPWKVWNTSQRMGKTLAVQHMMDAMRYGTTVMKDGKHVPMSKWRA